MEKRCVFAVLGLLLLLFGALMLPALFIAIYKNPEAQETFGLAMGFLFSLLTGGILLGSFYDRLKETALGTREGFAITTLGWAVLALAGAIPFYLGQPSHYRLSFADAYFESMSGLTTTGSTILSEIEGLGVGLLFWRSMTHWIGGMGIILLTVAILPFLGTGGFQLFRAEVPGPTKDRLKPRIVETAKTLWLIYMGFTVLEILLLRLCGLSLYDSICHTFGTVATGGFSTFNKSAGQFRLPVEENGLGFWRGLAAETVVVVFMFLAGCNFVLLYRSVLNRSLKPLWQSSEFKVYLAATVLAIVAISLMLAGEQRTRSENGVTAYSMPEAVRTSAFQVISIVTTTGYGTDDFDRWPISARVILLILMVAGACAGSTTGGIKQLRMILLAKFAWREIIKVIRPRSVAIVKHDNQVVEREIMSGLLGFFVLYMFTLGVATLIMATMLQEQAAISGAATSNDLLITAFTSCLATLGNVGPGLAAVGPMLHFGELPDLAKWFHSLLMLMGRLEIFTVLALLSPVTWRK